MNNRKSGILLHITSLPSPFGIGDLGPDAYLFAGFLKQSSQKIWQVLPLNPTEQIYGNSPYSSISAFAGNTLLISPAKLIDDGLLVQEDIINLPELPKDRVDFAKVIPHKENLLTAAYDRFKKKKKRNEFDRFCDKENYWLKDFALFKVISNLFKRKPWNEWPDELKNRDHTALHEINLTCREHLVKEYFYQYLFFSQWSEYKAFCNSNGIQIFGDIPIYVNYNSADVWAHPQFFKLDKNKNITQVAGVPPDYFSRTGQRWGNPVYDWNNLKKDDFSFWVQRIQHNLNLFDLMRIDHFRGFSACWEIPKDNKTAVKGSWAAVPGYDLFKTLKKHFSPLPIVAEDLGYITRDVRKMMGDFGFPGMKVLQFAFDSNDKNPYLPHNHIKNCIVYTGTHDNNTTRGWFKKDISKKIKSRVFKYLKKEVNSNEIHMALIRLAMQSVADTVIIPLQDILGLDSDARMNKPATGQGNWQWRLQSNQLTDSLINEILSLTIKHKR